MSTIRTVTSRAPEARPSARPTALPLVAEAEERPSQTWFDQLPAASVAPSVRPSELPAARPAGAPLASAAAGAVAGSIGAALALVAYLVTSQTRVTFEVAGLAVLAGAALGGLFGRVSRRLFRPTLRIFWAVAVALSSWLFTYAFVLIRFVPGFAHAVSFLPTALAVLVYGVCVGVAPPRRTRSERGRRA